MERGGIALGEEMTAKVLMYTKANCAYCSWAKQLLDAKHVSYEEKRVDLDPKILQEMQTLTTGRTVPQIFIGKRHVGGFDDLKALEETGELDTWLEA